MTHVMKGTALAAIVALALMGCATGREGGMVTSSPETPTGDMTDTLRGGTQGPGDSAGSASGASGAGAAGGTGAGGAGTGSN